MTARSWTLLRAPIVTSSTSPRTIAPNQMLDPAPRCTRPTTVAPSNTTAVSSMSGARSPKAAITRRLALAETTTCC